MTILETSILKNRLMAIGVLDNLKERLILSPIKDIWLVIPNKTVLENKDTYDTLKISLRHIDSHKSTMQYSQRIIEEKTEGPISLVGPSSQTLVGGQLTLYVNSLNQKGKASINIKMDDIEKRIELEVV